MKKMKKKIEKFTLSWTDGRAVFYGIDYFLFRISFKPSFC